MAQSGAKVTAVNAPAEAMGLYKTMAVTDARAIHPALQVEPADPEGDRQALEHLGLWMLRYSPIVERDSADGLTLDITGCEHLFGDETGLVLDLMPRLARFGLTARLAVAPTFGAAWAASRHASDRVSFIPAGQISETLAPLPVAGLRLDAGIVASLSKLGLKTIGHLIGKPRGPLVARFGMGLMHQLDRALGQEDENLTPLTPPPFYRAACRFAEPVTTLDAVEKIIAHLAAELADRLYHASKGARRIELSLFNVDGTVRNLELRISALSRDATHLARLLIERADQLEDRSGFGFEAAALSAFDVEDAAGQQHGFKRDGLAAEHDDGIAPLIDRFINRFGAPSVIRFTPRQSYLPERTAPPVSALDADPGNDWDAHIRAVRGNADFTRPVLLLIRPEPITNAIVEIPDKPPSRFVWRRRAHRVTRAEGPERIAPEWWRLDQNDTRTRDYYRVEDENGHRFWLFRAGLYDRKDAKPAWYMHGIFP